jgi:hypothetical protein
MRAVIRGRLLAQRRRFECRRRRSRRCHRQIEGGQRFLTERSERRTHGLLLFMYWLLRFPIPIDSVVWMLERRERRVRESETVEGRFESGEAWSVTEDAGKELLRVVQKHWGLRSSDGEEREGGQRRQARTILLPFQLSPTSPFPILPPHPCRCRADGKPAQRAVSR